MYPSSTCKLAGIELGRQRVGSGESERSTGVPRRRLPRRRRAATRQAPCASLPPRRSSLFHSLDVRHTARTQSSPPRKQQQQVRGGSGLGDERSVGRWTSGWSGGRAGGQRRPPPPILLPSSREPCRPPQASALLRHPPSLRRRTLRSAGCAMAARRRARWSGRAPAQDASRIARAALGGSCSRWARRRSAPAASATRLCRIGRQRTSSCQR